MEIKKHHTAVIGGLNTVLLNRLVDVVKELAQERLPAKVFYVLGGWRCRFFFRVEATIFALQEDWWLTSVEIRICPASILTHVSQVHAPLIFTSTCPTTEACLPRLHAIAVDATERFRGLLPGLLYPRPHE